MPVNSGLRPGQRFKSFRLTVLGGLGVSRDAGLLVDDAVQRRHLALLAVLAVHWKTGVSREKLASLLWPESDESNARNSLKQALHVLRHEIDPSVGSGTTQLRLGLPALTCDLIDFERRLDSSQLEAAVAVYAGALLEGFHLGHDAEEFERWVDGERARLARQHIEALETLAATAASRGDHRSALRWWSRLAELAPLESRFTEAAATTLLTLGDLGGALRLVESHRVVLDRDLSLPLGASLEHLLTAIRLAPRTHPPVGRTSEPAPASSTAQVRASDEQPTESDIPTNGWAPVVPRDGPWTGIPAGWLLVVAGLASVALVAGIASVAVSPRSPKSVAVAPDSMRVSIVRAEDPNQPAASLDLLRSVSSGIAERLSASTSAKPTAHVSIPGTDVREVGRLAGARFAVAVVLMSGADAIEVVLVDVATGEQLWGARQRAAADSSRGATGVNALAERAATAVAVRLDPSMANWIARASQPTSLDAYREFARGLQLYTDLQPGNAALHFARAARDSLFTMGLVMEAWSDIYAAKRAAADSIVILLQSRRLPPLDEALVDHLFAVLSGDLGAEHRASLAVSAAAPKSEWRYLQAESALKIGRASETVRLLDEMGPDLGWLRSASAYWTLFARALHFLGEYERELVVSKAARARFPTNRILIQMQVKALAALGKVADLEAAVEEALTLRQIAIWTDVQPMLQAVTELSAHGQPDAARRVALRTLAWVNAQPAARQTAWAAAIPMLLYHADSSRAARQRLEDIVAVTPDDEELSLLAVICAELGDKDKARLIAARLAQPAASRLLGNRLMYRASVAASLNERESAVSMLRDAYGAGFEWRTVVHIQPGMQHLRGYPPYEALLRPVE